MSEVVRMEHYAAAKPEPTMGVAGVDGESYDAYALAYAGGPDVNPQLTGRAKYAVYNEMRRSDPAVAGQLWLQKLPIRQAVWDLEPASEDGEDVLVADTLARQFGLKGEESQLDLSWDQQLAQALLLLDWGAMFEELVWGEPVDWTLDEGRTVYVRPLLRLAPRAPSSIQLITEDPTTGKVVEIRQDLPGSKPIPGEKLTWHVFEREGRNWYGSSFLRPIYGPWKLKRGLLISSAIAWDRWASGIPYVKHPSTPEGQKRAEEIGRSVRSHERAYVATPSDDDWDFQIVGAQGGIADPTPILRVYDEQIAIRGIAQFSVLGRTESGSRAVADVQVQPYYEGLRSLAGQIAGEKTAQVFRRFVDVNFGPQYDLPTLKFSKLGRLPIEVVATALANLFSAGFTFADRETQNDVRALLELPDLEEPQAAAKLMEIATATGIGPDGEPMPPSIPRAAITAAPREGDSLRPRAGA